ncbi:hypothetical protein TNCV_3977461 [Trichonephila clavipes]|nr:hypothetical protein TNCV_3977461 [Trichonephila clavipes]
MRSLKKRSFMVKEHVLGNLLFTLAKNCREMWNIACCYVPSTAAEWRARYNPQLHTRSVCPTSSSLEYEFILLPFGPVMDRK